MKHWRCSVCGYVHVGNEPPDKCPNCGAARDKFVEVAPEFDETQLPYAQKVTYGGQVEINQFFGEYKSIAPFIYNLPVGQAVKLHKHPTSDELFFILKGRFRFRVGSKTFVATPGDAVKGRMDIPHAFANIGDEHGVFLSVKGPKPVTTVFLE